jgi:superfamily II DNA or RNA helicase
VVDATHQAGDDRDWGDAVSRAFEPAARRLALSGTPFRSDTRAIPFVRYVGDEAVADFEYGYADALADGRVVRPVYFPRINGFMEWIAPDGAAQAAAFDDPLDRARAAQRLRTALSVEGEWLPTVLAQANERLGMLRRQQPDAGGLVVATDQDHAQGIADLLRYRCGVRATVAVSDDPRSSSRIARFSASSDSWIVAVRMVSEGVDIPRLRVGVYATTTTTELFFRQAVGRFVRWTRGVPRQKAYLFIPDDLRLRTWATQIADARRHSLRRPERDGGETVDHSALDALVHPDDRGEQLSMFAALSAVVTGAAESSVFDVDEAVLDHLDRQEDDAALELALPALPGAPAAGGKGHGDGNGANPRRERSALRERNARLVQDLVWATGLGHAQINGQLNRLVGLRRIDEATVEQLGRRARQAERWLAKTQQ